MPTRGNQRDVWVLSRDLNRGSVKRRECGTAYVNQQKCCLREARGDPPEPPRVRVLVGI